MLATLVLSALKALPENKLDADDTEMTLLLKMITRPTAEAKAGQKARDLALPVFPLARKVPSIKNPTELASKIVTACAASKPAGDSEISAEGGYINVTLSMAYRARVVALIRNGQFLAALSTEGKDRVMIE